MSKFKYSETEKQINSVLKHQDEALKSIHFPSTAEADAAQERLDYLQSLNILLQQAVKDLSHDLGVA